MLDNHIKMCTQALIRTLEPTHMSIVASLMAQSKPLICIEKGNICRWAKQILKPIQIGYSSIASDLNHIVSDYCSQFALATITAVYATCSQLLH